MLTSLTLALCLATGHAPRHTFSPGPDSWLMDGKPYLVRSGEMHYARVPRAYWADRMKRAKAMGLNTICTYVFWNFHEPEPGKFDFKGDHDVAEYVREAQRQGLNVILRPGPYVCSEWEWGGFPYWLANIPGIQIRQNNPQFLAASARWLDRLGKELAPLTIKRGGPIILCQVENEYGSFGNDHAYMAAIHRQLEHAGFDCQMYTADGSGRSMLDGGTLPDLPAAINFGGGAPDEFANLVAFRTSGPRMNGEFWCGWFDHWGEQHHTSGIQGEVRDLEWMLSRGDSVNLYMAHGGTTFGYMQGANSGGPNHFEPDTTSYDYDAPIAEDGTLTKKFWAFREVFKRHLNPGETVPDPPADNLHITVPSIRLSEYVDLMKQLPKPIHADHALSFEELHHPYGVVVYSFHHRPTKDGTLHVSGLQDRAWCGYGRLDRASGQATTQVQGVFGDATDPVWLVVESLGRVNFSTALLKERKGILTATVGNEPATDWSMYPLDLDHPDRFRFRMFKEPPFGVRMGAPLVNGPILQRGEFSLSKVGDTYLKVDEGDQSDGFVWVNGHNLGRWNSEGPQQALYCPAPYLRVGRNEVRVFRNQTFDPDGFVVGVLHPVFATHRYQSERGV
ncbi:MAG TPA: beta-galactosidase family protein [Fimbriimonadaceae bacterium]|nr:beta-galactosidase family protein [Fimbriimonadaceae bacterium]